MRVITTRDPPAYYATFVDLFLAVHARYVTYGIGYYAVFATKISGISDVQTAGMTMVG
jgi:hypothetical protein